jgi:molecular chaperone DnaK
VKDGQASALADEAGERLIPSVVSFHPGGNVLVGRGAKERRLQDAKNTIYSIKRLIGRSWDSEEVRRARSRFPFEMREGPGQAALVVARGETYTLPEISAFVLRKAKAVAEAALGTTVERAVITVPANFNDLQRAATKVAGRVAGLEVLRILNEPTAAALAYGYGKSTTERLAVYDFGGGTFDVTLLDLSDNVFEVLATAGNTFLGGDDVDHALADKMADEFLAVHRYDTRTDPAALERLRAAAESLKIQLSNENQARMRVTEVAHGPGGKALDLDFSITRAELERLVAPIVDRTFDVCREALGIARLQPTDFDQVLLVGGSTRIPLVRRRVEEFFKRQALGHISPEEVVAIGAGIQASALSGAERRRAEVPPAPRPAARDQAGAEPKGRPRQDTNPFDPPAPRARIDTNPFGPNTQPFSRERLPTSPGLQPSGAPSRVDAMAHTRPMIVQPPGGLPSERAPVTADQAGRKRQTTGQGLGVPPPPMAPVAARGRVKTGPGIGPGAEPPVGTPIARIAPVAVPAATLLSAQDAAQQARAAVSEGGGSPSSPDVTEMSQEQLAEKYGNLPLVMPAPPSAHPPPRDEDDEPTETGIARPKLSSMPNVLAPPQAPPPPPRGRAGTLVLGSGAGKPGKLTTEESAAFTVSDDDLEIEPELTERAEALAPPISAMVVDDITIVKKAPAPVDDGEDQLPIPDVPALEDEFPPAKAPHLAPPRQPAAAGAGRVESSPRAAAPSPAVAAATAAAAAAAAELWDAPPPPQFTPVPRVPPAATPPAPPPWAPAAPPPAPLVTAPMAAPPPFAPPAPPEWAPAAAAAPAAPWERPAAPAPPPYVAGFQPVAPSPSAFGHTAPLAQTAPLGPSAPLLVDVTPLSLTVETVNGYCDRIIQRNTPVPCERTRDFVTAVDNQTSVRVRVSQGESGKFRENTLLGELELDGLRPAPRGSVQIKVSFTLDTDGILNVSARDMASGRATSARVRLVGLPDAAHVEQMLARQQAQPLA